jgi:methylamine dehydrogenase heavy chain
MRQRIAAAALGALALAAAPGSGRAQLPAEAIGRVETLEPPLGPHWVWASDPVMRRTALVDLDAGQLLGMISGGWGVTVGLFAATRPEIYVPETHYSRGSRGERTDVVSVYDAVTLAPTTEVVIPPRRATNRLASGNAALLDGDRFAAVWNMTPASSISIVDVAARRFAGEIQTPGCGLVFAAGERRLVMLCGNGELLVVSLDAGGREASRSRAGPFFDPLKDPVTEKAVRWGDVWIFTSFEGRVHAVDVSGEAPTFPEPWSLFDAAALAEGWRIGGPQHLAVHAPSGRLFSLVHRGGPDTHKDWGTEVWVYDLARRERLQRIELGSPGFTYMGVPLEFGREWPWPLNRLHGWLLDTFAAGLGIGEIAVTPDARPLLVAAADYTGSMAVYDAGSGELLRRVNSGNFATVGLQAPWNGQGVEP